MRYTIISVLTFVFFISALSAQTQKVRIYGYVVDENNRSIEDANVQLSQKNARTVGAVTNQNGYYDISTEVTDSFTVSYSHLGYQTIQHTFAPKQKIMAVSVQLPLVAKELKDITITGMRQQTTPMATIDPSKYKLMPNTSGSFESILLTFTGVTMNNELSSQYNVRGGNFDENIVYVNGTEIYKPLLIRAGQQEGLSFINPDMVGNVSFAAGGFNVEYGDKMSSVLDIKYKKPKSFESSGMFSLLGASAYIGTAGKKFTQMHGIRYKTSGYLLGTLDTKGEYNPSFVDYQTYLTYQVSPKLEATFLGNFSRNNFNFIPSTQTTTFGTYNMGRKFTVFFDGQEKDLFQTYFGAFTLNYTPKNNLKLNLQASAFRTNENETYDITGEYFLSEVKMNLDSAKKEGEQLGVGLYHQHARNRLKATVASLTHGGEWIKGKHTVKWGITGQIEKMDDRISEWEWRDSTGYSMPYLNDGMVQLYYNLKSKNTLDTWRNMNYVQDTYRWNTDGAFYTLTGGVRTNFWSYNKEFLISPRVSFSIIPHWKKDFVFRAAAGIYYQSPFYKEFRDTVSDNLGNVKVLLNENIKAQRSAHFVLGGDYYFRALGRPFKFTAEAYVKLADRIISYTVDNVRVRYSGQNDSKAYTAGVDFKLFGELVAGTDSWINFSLMQSKQNVEGDMKYNPQTKKYDIPIEWISRPSEQRYAFSMLFTDYLPNNPKYKLHLRAIFNDGLPVGLPRSKYYNPVFRTTSYKRVDIGASRVLVSGSDKLMNKSILKYMKNLWLEAEIFNLFDFRNVNSYYWVSDFNGMQYAVPNYLTRRQFNVKLIMEFK